MLRILNTCRSDLYSPSCIQNPYCIFSKTDWLDMIWGDYMHSSSMWSERLQDCEWRHRGLTFNHNLGKNSCFTFFSFWISSAVSGEYECTLYQCTQTRDNWAFLVSCPTRHNHCTTSRSKGVPHMCTCAWIVPHTCVFVSMYSCGQQANAYALMLEQTDKVRFALEEFENRTHPLTTHVLKCTAFFNMRKLM